MNPRDVHPDSDRLFDFVEGVLGRRDAAEVRGHVEGCWQCRTAVTEVETAIREFVSFRRDVLVARLAPPPRAWKRLPDAPAAAKAPSRIARPIWLALAAALAVGAAALVIPRLRDEPAPRPVRTQPESPEAASVPRPTRPPEPAPFAPTPAPGPNTEVRIATVLHRLGLDLGAPIEISRSGEEWIVTATGLKDEQESALRAALAPLPRTRFVDAEPSAPETLPAGDVSRPARQTDSPFQPEFEKHLGSRAAFRAFADRALDHSDALLLRVHALRALDQRFGQAQLDSADRRLLAAIRQDHDSAIRALVPGLEEDAEMIRAALALGNAPTSGSVGLLAAAQRWDRLLSVLVAGSNPAPAGLRESIAPAAAELQAALRGLP